VVLTRLRNIAPGRVALERDAGPCRYAVTTDRLEASIGFAGRGL
jgi:hypothetical protein